MSYPYDFKNSLSVIDSIKDSGLTDFVYTYGRDNFKNNGNLPFQAKVACITVKIKNGRSESDDSTYLKILGCLYSEISVIIQSTNTHLLTQYGEDTIIGLYNTRFKVNIEELIRIAAKITSITKVINVKFNSNDFQCCVGIDYNIAYIVDGAYSEERSTLVASGPALINSKKIISLDASTIFITKQIHQNLSESYTKFFRELENCNEEFSVYTANLINTQMETWIKSNQSK